MKPIVTTLTVAVIMLSILLTLSCDNDTPEPSTEYRVDSIYFAMNPMDIEFDTSEMKTIDKALGGYIEAYRAYRAIPLPNSVMPALQFNPLPHGFTIPPATGPMQWNIPDGIQKPASPYALAFMSIPTLAALLRSGQTTSLELTQF